MVGDVGEMAVVRDEGTVGVAVPVSAAGDNWLSQWRKLLQFNANNALYSLLPNPLHAKNI